MSLFFRMALTILRSFFRKPLGPLEESVLTLRVWPNDLDINGHMNNGRYLTLMDLGRLDLIARTELLKVMLRRRWRPLVGSATIRFRRSLGPFQKYQLKTRAIYWNEKWFYCEQRFERAGELIAVGMIKGLLRGPNGNIPIAEVLRGVGISTPSPEAPPAIQRWREMEAGGE